MHLPLLAVAVDAAHALLEAVGVPGDVIVDHEGAELEVDALPARLGGDHHLRLLAELVLGSDALVEVLATMQGDHRQAPTPQPLGQVIEGLPRLGEDEHLLATMAY